MAVTLTVEDLRARASDRRGADVLVFENMDTVSLWYESAKAEVETYAPSAPETLQNLGTLMMFDYWCVMDWPAPLVDQMDGGTQRHLFSAPRMGNALRYSGAMALLSKYKVRRAL